MIIKKTTIKLLVPLLIYLTAIITNNITITGYGRPTIVMYALIFSLSVYLYFFYTNKPGFFLLPKFFQIVFSVLLISSTINSLLINDFRILFTYLSFIFIFLTISKYLTEIGDTSLEINNTIFFFKLIIWINLFIILLCLAFDNLYIYRYEGIFDKPNSMGRFAGCSVILSSVCIFFVEKERKFKFICFLVLVFSIVFLILSNSRSPLLASIVSFLLLLSTYAIIRKKKIKIIIFTIFLFFILWLLFNYFFYEILDIYKFKFERGDGSSGRSFLWSEGMRYFSFFGSSEYNNISYKYDVHNNYLNQALKYGIINSISFHLIPIYIFFKSFKKLLYFQKLDVHLALILGMSSFLIVYYIFETASMIAPFWLMISFTAISYKKIWYTEIK